jgi:hypothetical protein
MANLSSSKKVNNLRLFIPILLVQERSISCNVFNNPPGHLTKSGQQGLQYNACNNSLDKYNAS